MKQAMSIVLALMILLSAVAVPGSRVLAGDDDFETLEFFLDQALKRTDNPATRNEILNRYLIKALGLMYEQNKELIRLNRATLNALQELRDAETKEAR